mmetsp:Transcript_144031/g.460975  ORF Transcript_144031/g.460975 Transcript_144031/m.460975 type:complete len:261 (-) Transcript_144031:2218-3000(-)
MEQRRGAVKDAGTAGRVAELLLVLAGHEFDDGLVERLRLVRELRQDFDEVVPAEPFDLAVGLGHQMFAAAHPGAEEHLLIEGVTRSEHLQLLALVVDHGDLAVDHEDRGVALRLLPQLQRALVDAQVFGVQVHQEGEARLRLSEEGPHHLGGADALAQALSEALLVFGKGLQGRRECRLRNLQERGQLPRGDGHRAAPSLAQEGTLPEGRTMEDRTDLLAAELHREDAAHEHEHANVFFFVALDDDALTWQVCLHDTSAS